MTRNPGSSAQSLAGIGTAEMSGSICPASTSVGTFADHPRRIARRDVPHATQIEER